MDAVAELHQCVDGGMVKLVAIWDDIGIVGEQRSARNRVVLMHLGNLLDEMVREEDQLRSRLVQNVDKYRTEVTRLCTELNVPLHEPPERLTILQMEKDLRGHAESLSSQKQKRLQQLRQRLEVDKQLCDSLGTTPFVVPSSCVVPSEQQLADLDERIRELETEKVKRQKAVSSSRQNVVRLLAELELSPNTSFERELVSDGEMVSLTPENMDALKRYSDELEELRSQNAATLKGLWERVRTLWDRVEMTENDRSAFQSQNNGISQRVVLSLKEEVGRCEVLKLDNIHRVVGSVRQQLREWQEKCCLSDDECQAFQPLHEEVLTEDVLVAHEQELSRLRNYYEQHKDLLEKVERWKKLWEQFLEYEHRASNPDRLLNRGCSLLKEEKAKKKICSELPKVEQEVTDLISEWQLSASRTFFVCGQTFADYVKTRYSEYTLDKENEKILRQQQKARQMEEEILYGSKPAGTKRFAGNTPTKTPSKVRKVNDTPNKTPLGQRTRCNGPAFFSPVCLPPRSASKEKLCSGSSRANAESRRVPFTEQVHNTPTSSAPPSTTIVASCANTANVNMDASQFSVGHYDDFASGIDRSGKPNCRSTLAPKPRAFF